MQNVEVLKKIVKQNPSLLFPSFLENKTRFEMTTDELVVLEYIWMEVSKENYSPSNKLVAELSGIPEKQISPLIISLMKKEIIHISTLTADGKVVEKIDADFIINKFLLDTAVPEQTTNRMKDFVLLVESEFSKPLSAFEIKKIEKWVYDDKYSYEMLEEALNESVLAGVKNFKYMDAILLNWKQFGKNEKKIKRTKNVVKEVRDKEFSQEEKEIAAFDWISSLGDTDD